MITMLAELQSHLPQEELNFFDDKVRRAIIDNPHIAGREFMRFLQNGARVQVLGEHIIDCDIDPYIPDGWKLEEHHQGGQFLWDPTGIKLITKLEVGEEYVLGPELRKRLAKEPVLNANVLDYLLANPHLISEEWKDKRISFFGTIYRGPRGNIYIRYLNWKDSRWCCSYNWIDFSWSYGNLVAVSVSHQRSSKGE